MPSGHTESARVLVVDDEQVIREILSEFLTMEGYVVRSVEDGERALSELKLRPYDMVISDLKMPRLSGLQLLEKIAAENLNVLTVIMTGFGTVETANGDPLRCAVHLQWLDELDAFGSVDASQIGKPGHNEIPGERTRRGLRDERCGPRQGQQRNDCDQHHDRCRYHAYQSDSHFGSPEEPVDPPV